MDNGDLMLAHHVAPVNPMFFMVLIFSSYTLMIGGWLIHRLSDSATEAQDIVMYPEEHDPNQFFFVPDYDMGVLSRFIFKVNQALDYWMRKEHLTTFTEAEGLALKSLFSSMRDQIATLRKYCDMVTELNDPMINANLEHLRQHVSDLDIILGKFLDAQEFAYYSVTFLYS